MYPSKLVTIDKPVYTRNSKREIWINPGKYELISPWGSTDFKQRTGLLDLGDKKVIVTREFIDRYTLHGAKN